MRCCREVLPWHGVGTGPWVGIGTGPCPAGQPSVVPAKGLSRERQAYLYKEIRVLSRTRYARNHHRCLHLHREDHTDSRSICTVAWQAKTQVFVMDAIGVAAVVVNEIKRQTLCDVLAGLVN